MSQSPYRVNMFVTDIMIENIEYMTEIVSIPLSGQYVCNRMTEKMERVLVNFKVSIPLSGQYVCNFNNRQYQCHYI